jgi:hypothetical protein
MAVTTIWPSRKTANAPTIAQNTASRSMVSAVGGAEPRARKIS